MPIKIAVISDTHCYEWEEVHPDMRTLVAECDMAIHCGDIVRQSVVEGFLKSAKKGLIVHGNSDPVDLRESLPYTQVIEVEKTKIGITHPAWGGPEFPPSDLFKDFDEALDFAIQERQFLILQAYQKAKHVACKDGKDWAQEAEE